MNLLMNIVSEVLRIFLTILFTVAFFWWLV